MFQWLLIVKVKQASGGNLSDRLQNKLCYNEVNVVEAFVVSFTLLWNFMLAQTVKQFYKAGRSLKISNNTQNNAAAVIVCVAKQ